jgi:hypothetical protein
MLFGKSWSRLLSELTDYDEEMARLGEQIAEMKPNESSSKAKDEL